MNDYCPYCIEDYSNELEAYGCGSPVGAVITERSRECMVREIAILRAEKQHLMTQNYDLSRQLRIYSNVVNTLRKTSADGTHPLVQEVLAGLAALNIPYGQRDDMLTTEHRERVAAMNERYKDM